MSFGQTLKELRTEKKLTQQELAQMLNLSKANVSKYESDTIEPNIETIQIISKIFNVSSDYLLGITNDTTYEKNESMSNIEAAIKLQQKLSNLDFDIEDEKELETILRFIDSNKDMLKMLLEKKD